MAGANGESRKLVGTEDALPDTPGSSPKHAEHASGAHGCLLFPLTPGNQKCNTKQPCRANQLTDQDAACDSKMEVEVRFP